jgi:hypothetical protein
VKIEIEIPTARIELRLKRERAARALHSINRDIDGSQRQIARADDLQRRANDLRGEAAGDTIRQRAEIERGLHSVEIHHRMLPGLLGKRDNLACQIAGIEAMIAALVATEKARCEAFAHAVATTEQTPTDPQFAEPADGSIPLFLRRTVVKESAKETT